MILKVVKYKQYGLTFGDSKEEKSRFTNEFYWSFIELSNGKILSINNDIVIESDKIIHSGISCHYTERYNFGEDFFDWWGETMGDYDKDLGYPTYEEEELTINFYKENIDSNREIKTNIILLK